MKFLNKTFLIALAALNSLSIYAQNETVEETPAPTFSVDGTLDTYFRSTQYGPNTSFADLNGFSLGMANIILSYEGGKSGFVADLVYGPRGIDAVFNEVGSSNIVNQLYIYYNVSDRFTLTMGNFNTFLGYEVISPAANFNYSTSYMFSYGPFSHTGIKADFSLSENTSLMIGVLNQTDFTTQNFVGYDMTEAPILSEDYMFGVQLGLYGQYINFLTGDGYTQIDFTGGFDLTENFFLGINATSADADTGGKFSGVALYPQLALSDSFSVGLRGEIFNEEGGFGAVDTDGIMGTADVKNTSFTITGSYTSGNLIIKPELRIDSASDKVYSDPTLTDSLSSFVLAAIYSF